MDDAFQRSCEEVTAEIASALAEVDPREVAALEEAVLACEQSFVAGAGRSGLVARCFAMRLRHLGLPAHVVGEMTAPPAKSGDLVIAVSRSGETPTTCAVARAAIRLGARVIAVTASPDSPLGRDASARVVIPTGGGSVQFGGSVFEQTVMLMFDVAALRLQRRLGLSEDEMRARHANLE